MWTLPLTVPITWKWKGAVTLLSNILHKEICYAGSRSQKPSSWEKAIQLLEAGTVVPENIVTSIVPLENWREAFEASIRGEGVKAVIRCAEDPDHL